MILNVEDFEEENGLVVFRLADVQENRPQERHAMSRRRSNGGRRLSTPTLPL